MSIFGKNINFPTVKIPVSRWGCWKELLIENYEIADIFGKLIRMDAQTRRSHRPPPIDQKGVPTWDVKLQRWFIFNRRSQRQSCLYTQIIGSLLHHHCKTLFPDDYTKYIFRLLTHCNMWPHQFCFHFTRQFVT